jgi:transposase
MAQEPTTIITEVMGIDVSKNTLDVHLHRKAISLCAQPNNAKGYQAILKWLHKHLGKDLCALSTVMEHTGIYTYGLEQFLFGKGISYVKRPALDIKRSSGVVRGKSDKTDAVMIAGYGYKNREELSTQRSTPCPRQQLRLRQLMAHRDAMVSDRAGHKNRIGEMKEALGKEADSFVIASSERTIAHLSEQIKLTEKEIKSLLATNAELDTNYRLILSVPGFGFVTAVHLILCTENFSRFEGNARKFNCYAGAAPFPHSSGSSIRGRTRVSHLANKTIKSLLTLCAISAIQHDPELKAKYNQKLSEGKPKMSVINIIRAKLVQRVFAVINRQTPYLTRQAA